MIYSISTMNDDLDSELLVQPNLTLTSDLSLALVFTNFEKADAFLELNWLKLTVINQRSNFYIKPLL